ncbi:6469_t:CDS:2, partial [Gigaspora rosea]
MGQLRRCKLSKATGRKPIWFEEIEQIILEGPSTRKIKPEWQWDMINTLAPRAKLLKISIDKRKKEKSDKSEIKIEQWQTENDESVHTTRLKKLSAAKQLVKKGKEVGEFFLEIPLESLVEKRNKVKITGNRPHIDNQQLSIIEIATREEELISIHLEESQAKKGAKKVIQDLVNLVQSRFIEHIWKFRCELTAEWEEKEDITKDNKHKPKKAKKKAEMDPVRKRRKGKEKQIPHAEASGSKPQPERNTQRQREKQTKKIKTPMRRQRNGKEKERKKGRSQTRNHENTYKDLGNPNKRSY